MEFCRKAKSHSVEMLLSRKPSCCHAIVCCACSTSIEWNKPMFDQSTIFRCFHILSTGSALFWFIERHPLSAKSSEMRMWRLRFCKRFLAGCGVVWSFDEALVGVVTMRRQNVIKSLLESAVTHISFHSAEESTMPPHRHAFREWMSHSVRECVCDTFSRKFISFRKR